MTFLLQQMNIYNITKYPILSHSRLNPYLNSDENDNHPLQPQAVFLTQVASHQIC